MRLTALVQQVDGTLDLRINPGIVPVRRSLGAKPHDLRKGSIDS
jgi:hypothetical protein